MTELIRDSLERKPPAGRGVLAACTALLALAVAGVVLLVAGGDGRGEAHQRNSFAARDASAGALAHAPSLHRLQPIASRHVRHARAHRAVRRHHARRPLLASAAAPTRVAGAAPARVSAPAPAVHVRHVYAPPVTRAPAPHPSAPPHHEAPARGPRPVQFDSSG